MGKTGHQGNLGFALRMDHPSSNLENGDFGLCKNT
jgi:hypothetical protein